MDLEAIVTIATAGLSPEDAAVVRKAIIRDGVKEKFTSLKTAEEVNSIQAAADKVTEMQNQLDGMDQQGNPVGYRAWYKKFGTAVLELQGKVNRFETKYGQGALDKALEGQLQLPTSDGKAPVALSEDDIRRIAGETWTKTHAPTVGNTIVVASKLLQRHMLAGRRNEIDFDGLSKLANEKYGGNMEAAYVEYDKPERDKLEADAKKKAEEDKEAEIKRRVDEELQKRGSTLHFPAEFSTGPSVMTERSKDSVEKFDKAGFKEQLARDFVKAGQAA